MKIRPEGAQFFHAGRRTYMTKIIVAFRGLQTLLTKWNILSCIALLFWDIALYCILTTKGPEECKILVFYKI